MSRRWSKDDAGVIVLPSGRMVRGRGLRNASLPGPAPDLGVYLLGTTPPTVEWNSLWIKWPDFWIPRDRLLARRVLEEAWERSLHENVEIACSGGKGRTGTALACLAVLDGVDPRESVSFVRQHYHHRAVETPWQRRYVERFTSS